MENTLTILFLTYTRTLFGANKSLLALMLDLRERYNVKPVVLMYDKNDGPLAEELEKYNIPYIISPMKFWVVGKDTKLKYLRGFKGYIENKKNIQNILEKVQNYDINLVYTNNSTVQIGAMLADKLNAPHIWYVREFGAEYGDYDFVFNYPRRIVKKWFKKASSVITISDVMYNYVKNGIGKYANVVRIYNGVANSKPIRESFNENDKLQFCIVGALNEGKNQLELLKAANILSKQNKDFHINIIGSGDEYEKILKEYVENNNLDEFVTFWGYRSNVSEILDKMDVGVICSKAEAFGRATVEYMFSSMPVIGADCGGTSEIIDDNQTGFLYKLGNAQELADKMSNFIDERICLREMGTNAFEKANTAYSLKNNTDSIYKLIDNPENKEKDN